jgi:hypothetical protein
VVWDINRASVNDFQDFSGRDLSWATARRALRVSPSPYCRPFAGHVADHQSQKAIRQRDEVVEVTRPSGWLVVDSYAPTWQAGEALGAWRSDLPARRSSYSMRSLDCLSLFLRTSIATRTAGRSALPDWPEARSSTE